MPKSRLTFPITMDKPKAISKIELITKERAKEKVRRELSTWTIPSQRRKQKE